MRRPAHPDDPGGPSVAASSRLKRSELAASFGAGLVGGGLGLLAASYVADLALPMLLAGTLMHAWGMYDKHTLERDLARPEAPWMKALYWLCWLVLAGLAVLIIARALL
ncbi:hypothetical protein [Bosea beijingensis]